MDTITWGEFMMLMLSAGAKTDDRIVYFDFHGDDGERIEITWDEAQGGWVAH
jgi:hypothetical protein